MMDLQVHDLGPGTRVRFQLTKTPSKHQVYVLYYTYLLGRRVVTSARLPAAFRVQHLITT